MRLASDASNAIDENFQDRRARLAKADDAKK
jgi:hypothetical protein